MATFKRLYAGKPLHSTPTELYTVPTGKTVLLKQLLACHHFGSAQQVTLYLLPAGGSFLADNVRMVQGSVDVGGVLDWQGSYVLNDGDKLLSMGTTDGALAVSLTGVEL